MRNNRQQKSGACFANTDSIELVSAVYFLFSKLIPQENFRMKSGTMFNKVISWTVIQQQILNKANEVHASHTEQYCS
jgi:hypothetical protein